MYPPGLPTPDGIVSLLITVFKAYREARQADEKFEAAKDLLNSFGLSLNYLERTAESNDILRCQVRVARKAWKELHNYLDDFEPGLQKDNARSIRFRTYKKLQWALDELDGKLKSLYSQIDLCFSAAMPAIHISTDYKIEKLSNELLRLRQALLPNLDSLKDDTEMNSGEGTGEESRLFEPKNECIPSPCWRKKGGCFCRCHSHSRITHNQNRHLFINLAGFPSLFRTCNLQSCNSRRYALQLRFAASKYGLPVAFMAALELSSSWIPTISLTTSRVCRYTSPGFTLLWELERKSHERFERSQKVADIKRLLSSGEATFQDVDPSGEGWLDKLLDYPWPLGFRDEQWELIIFIVANSPQCVLENPRLLHKCATWIGEGWHMEMLDTLLGLGLDPGNTDAICFQEWPALSSPGWISEMLTPDPMFVEWMQKSLRKEPGYAGCDALSESVLTGSTSEFDNVLARAKDANGLLRAWPNVLGQMAVHLAIIYPARLKKLLQAGMDPDAVDNGGSTPLMYAACYGYCDSVLHLLEYTKHPMVADRRNRRVFIDYAIRRQHIDVVDAVIRTLRGKGSNASAMIVLDRCLRYYFGSGFHIHDIDLSILDRLFRLGADPDVHNGQSSLLHFVIFPQEVQRILKAGFTAVNSSDQEGITPLMKVMTIFDPPSTKQLIQRGASVNSQDNFGWTAMHHSMHTISLDQFGISGQDLDDRIFRKWVDVISTCHLALKSGAELFLRDHCKCACSAGGCSVITIALHRTVRDIGSPLGSSTVPPILVDLLCIVESIVESRTLSSLRLFLHDLVRYRMFDVSGLEHSCCFWKADLMHKSASMRETNELQHSQFNAAFIGSTAESISAKDAIIRELATLFRTLEIRAQKEQSDAMDRGEPKRTEVLYETDEKNDTFRETYFISTLLPQLSRFDFDGHRAHLARARDPIKGLGLQQRATLDPYIDKALDILYKIETSMRDLDCEIDSPASRDGQSV